MATVVARLGQVPARWRGGWRAFKRPRVPPPPPPPKDNHHFWKREAKRGEKEQRHTQGEQSGLR